MLFLLHRKRSTKIKKAYLSTSVSIILQYWSQVLFRMCQAAIALYSVLMDSDVNTDSF